MPQPTPALKSLCEAIASLANSTADSITILADLDNDVFYSVDSAVGASPTSACVSLASLLEPTSNLKFSRMQRFRVALTLASSHLQLHSTPWLQEQWSAASVHLPVLTSDNSTTILGEPYLSQHFHITPSTTSTPSKPDRSFVSLGIVLLELCFGRRFDDCSFWSQPGFALLKDNPNMRLTMACQWLEDVEGDAGVDYASAVEWTLRQAPVAAKDNNWRLDFAENVVQPLARYCELLYGIQAVP